MVNETGKQNETVQKNSVLKEWRLVEFHGQPFVKHVRDDSLAGTYQIESLKSGVWIDSKHDYLEFEECAGLIFANDVKDGEGAMGIYSFKNCEWKETWFSYMKLEECAGLAFANDVMKDRGTLRIVLVSTGKYQELNCKTPMKLKEIGEGVAGAYSKDDNTLIAYCTVTDKEWVQVNLKGDIVAKKESGKFYLQDTTSGTLYDKNGVKIS